MDKYYQAADEALNAATGSYNKLMSIALGEAKDEKEEVSDKVKNAALLTEGFRPIVTPDKQIKWVPKPKQPSDALHTFQKMQASMSPETLREQYPFLQYAEKHFIPVVEELVQGLQNQTYSIQYFQEQMLALTKGGLKEAIDNTGGMSKQGKGSISNSTSAEETARLIMKEKNAYKQVVEMSDYAKGGMINMKGGE
ncbi:hypothetical protein [Klebsiella variicola]|uniref:hypothetical protein n=1 Tax=Klebsiella variicola TaxID=244366 RepID=UPI0034DEAAD1